MKSKFRFWAYLLGLLMIVFSVMLVGVLSGSALNKNIPFGFFLIACLFFLFVWIWMFFGELRTKAISFNVEHRSFIVKPYLGLGTAKKYDLDDIAGFKTSILSSKSGSYEYLYLLAGGKRIVKLSEFYHSNYIQIKKYLIAINIKNLGMERFSYREELKDTFR
ncbi:hypothetical protein [Mucilaginibacter ginsenosidivorans]|uniref:Uncharacterized protein n=1 Tax=Mucilaginibacter ginsenosidivorans TaxID=398053 RepID=A0A5B8V0H5_9SPHI|nr:hypothetical protein [Mucilaginibacter ginsenosidivorans]QEC65007.1 hypothetical protein FRZ54_21345 [Mucilaginibacter ginsenosidivorans]